MATAATVGTTTSRAPQDPPGDRTSRSGVFEKAQADRGKVTYDKVCAQCHTPVPDKKIEGPALIGDAFFKDWEDRTLYQLAQAIRTTMPPDGSVALSVEETADVVAHVLQLNGMPAGTAPLKADESAKGIKIVR